MKLCPSYIVQQRPFVYPSLYEGFGLPPLEAMACGCPVISSSRGSLGEVVGNAAELVEPEDISALSKALLVLASQSEVRDRLRAAGLVQAMKFDWKRTAAETIRIYEKARRKVSRGHHGIRIVHDLTDWQPVPYIIAILVGNVCAILKEICRSRRRLNTASQELRN
jgi:hypothetical protein